MAVPKNRHTKSRRNRRRAHIRLPKINMVLCEKCESPKPPHFICENCGTYKGIEAIDVLKKVTKLERKRQEAEAAEAEQGQSNTRQV